MTTEAKQRLLKAVPYFRSAIKTASTDGVAELAILKKTPDGTKHIIVVCAAGELFEDIAAVIDAPAQTDKDEMRAKAREFLDKHGLKRDSQ